MKVFRLAGLLACVLLVSACQKTVSVKDEAQPSDPEPDLPLYSELTRQETELTLERLKKIREKPAVRRYTGPVRHAWDRIRARARIGYEDNLRIEKQATYLLRDRDYVTRVSERAGPFIYYILEEIDKRDLPPELALLPVIESAYRPTAVSRSKATGLWQFISSTARHLGMKRTRWYDARRDVIASTRYALDYLKMLNEKYSGDWLLAIASYNGGPGTVSRAIEKNRRLGKPVDYWHLDLPKETMNYVPRFLAATRIYTYPEDYGVKIVPAHNAPYFSIMDSNGRLGIRAAAKMADMPLNDFRHLNSGYLTDMIPAGGPNHVVVPAHKAHRFRAQLAKLPENQRGGSGRYQIRPGDTLGKIAKRFGVSVALLKQSNNLSGSLIRSGDTLHIPASDTTEKHPAATRQDNTPTHVGDFYSVKHGDTLWRIAKLHKMDIDRLLDLNNLAYRSVIRPGQRLRIRTGKHTPVALGQ